MKYFYNYKKNEINIIGYDVNCYVVCNYNSTIRYGWYDLLNAMTMNIIGIFLEMWGWKKNLEVLNHYS